MRKELLTYKDPKSPVSEVFRTLRTNIQFMNTNRKLKTLLVTSTFPEEGKSWITSNLAVTFAQAGKRVILVDADMRKGRQYNIFGTLPKPGLSNYLSNMDAENNETNDVNIVNYIQETDVENLHILTAGNVPPNPSELLVSHRMRDLLQELKNMCDLVIIDGTPCDLVTDALILSRIVDSTIVVAAQKETKKDNLVRIVKNIQNVGGRIAGVVLNKVDVSAKKYNQSYYYGSISSGNGTSKKKKKTQKEIAKMEGAITNLFKNSSEEEIIDDNYEKELKQEELTKNQALDKEDLMQNIKLDFKDDLKNESVFSNESTKHEELNTNNIKENEKNDIVQETIEKYNVNDIVENIQETVNKGIEEGNKETELYNNEEIKTKNYQPTEEYQSSEISQPIDINTKTEAYQTGEAYNSVEAYNPPVEENTKIEYDIYRNENKEYDNTQEDRDFSVVQQEKEEYRRITEQIKNNNKNYKKNKKKNRNKRYNNNFVKEKMIDKIEKDYYENNRNNETVKKYQETEATIQEEGKISEIKIEKSMDEKTKEILRQVNEYIEAEKKRQGEKY